MKINKTTKWVIIWIVIFSLAFGALGYVLIAANSIAQQNKETFLVFRGVVTDQSTNKPISGASVVVGYNESVVKVYSDSNGAYTANVPYPTFNVNIFVGSAKADGYLTMYSQVSLSMMNITKLDTSGAIITNPNTGNVVSADFYGYVTIDFALFQATNQTATNSTQERNQ